MSFVEKNDKVFVTAYAVELYLPAEYYNMGYRGTNYFEVFGKEVRVFAMGLMKIYNTATAFATPLATKPQPLGIPGIISTIPDHFEIRECKVVKDGPDKKWLIIRFMKDDQIMHQTTVIKSLACMNMLISRVEGGKLDFLEPGVVVQCMRDSEKMNGTPLKVPTEEMEMFVGERYRDPLKPSRKYRFTEETDPNKMLAYNMREDAMQTSTFQGVTHEDMNNALLVGANRHAAGILSEPTTMEKVYRGMPLDEEKAAIMIKR